MMKKILLSLVLLCCIGVARTQPRAKVSECFELTGVVFRLSGEKVFVQSTPENYVADMDAYFSIYKDHELIRFIRKALDARHDLDLSMIADLAADMDITSKGIVFTRRWITLYESEDYGKREEEWSKAELKEYLRLLNKFYKDTRFHRFYEAHLDFYAEAEKKLQPWVDKIDTAWFSDFFGQPFAVENIWVVPAFGSHNFAVSRKDRQGKEHFNSVVCYPKLEDGYFAYLNWRVFMTLLHEICHNYNNPVCEAYAEVFAPICDTLYAISYEGLREIYCGKEDLLYESMNRLCEYTYCKSLPDFPKEELKRRIVSEEMNGFFWLEELLQYMEVFYLNRDRFPTYRDFMPQIKLFMDNVVANLENYYLPKLQKLQLLRPQVVGTYPMNGSVVDTTLDKLIIVFSLPIQDGMIWLPDVSSDDIKFSSKEMYWADERTYVIPLSQHLKPHSRYSIRMPSFFRPVAKEYYYRAQPFEFTFETR